MPTGQLSELTPKPQLTASTGAAKLSDITPAKPISISTGKAKLSDIAPPKIEMPNLNNSIKSGLTYASDKASQFGNWATTSLMPDAEEGVGELAGKIPVIGDYAKPVAKFITGGLTSPVGLASLGLGSLGIKAYKAANAAKLIKEGPLTAEQALVAEVQGARPYRQATDKLRSEALGARFGARAEEWKKLGGEGGANISERQLAGELPKVTFPPLRDKFPQSNVDDFYNQIRDSKLLSEGDKQTAKKGLDKILNVDAGGVPQTAEINHLTTVFGPELGNALQSKLGVSHKILDAAGVPRTLMASGDVSFPFRQNISNVSRPDFWKNIPEMIKATPQAGYDELVKVVKADPHYELAMRSGVDVGDFIHEENFASKIAKYYPGVKNSENAFSGYAKKMRMDLFSELVDKAKAGGNFLQGKPIDAYVDGKYARELAKFVNISTGRGTLKVGAGNFTADLERSSKVLNTAFFSPRLASSRIQMFSKIFDPNTPTPIRKEYVRNALGYMGFQGAALTAMSLGGAEVVTKLTSSDFGKAKVGNTRLDFSGGVAPYVRLLAQIAYQKKTSSITGKDTDFNVGYKPTTTNDAIGSFVTQKAAPLPATALDIGRGWKDAVGQPVTISSEAVKLMTPILAQDIYDILKDDPNNLPYIIPAMFGVGIQTYSEKNIPKVSTKQSPYVTMPKIKLN